jgi:hypothetical protein
MSLPNTEWVFLAATYHYVLAQSPSPEAAKAAINDAWRSGQLELRCELRTYAHQPKLKPENQPLPAITRDHVLNPDEAYRFKPWQPEFRLVLQPWDWERSYGSGRDRKTKEYFEYVNIVGRREQVLALWPKIVAEPAAEPPTANRRDGISDLVWAVIQTLDAMEHEHGAVGLAGIRRDRLLEDVRRRLPDRPTLSPRTSDKAIAERRKRAETK